MTGAIAGPVWEGWPDSDFSARKRLGISVIIALTDFDDAFGGSLNLVRFPGTWATIPPLPRPNCSDLNAKLLGSYGVPHGFDIVD
jgi:hypothetical protein